jgi:hypothetical protein
LREKEQRRLQDIKLERELRIDSVPQQVWIDQGSGLLSGQFLMRTFLFYLAGGRPNEHDSNFRQSGEEPIRLAIRVS